MGHFGRLNLETFKLPKEVPVKYFSTFSFQARRLGKIQPLNEGGKARLAWFDEIYRIQKQGIRLNIKNLCQYKFGISKSTFYRWRHRFNRHYLPSLNDKKRGRKNGIRFPQELATKLIGWKLANPAKGHEYCWQWHKKYEIKLPICPTTIYRLWKDKKLLHLITSKSKRKRKPFKKIQTVDPGYLQIDTKHLGKNRFQYTAKDLASRYRKLFGTARIDGKITIKILEEIIRTAPFKILFVQFDNGLEFGKEVEEWLAAHGIVWQHTWIRESDQNGAVESSHKTDEREFYPKFSPNLHTLGEYKHALARWEWEYNNIRLHSAIGWQTPVEYIKKHIQKVSH